VDKIMKNLQIFRWVAMDDAKYTQGRINFILFLFRHGKN
jgi:hypothetical protein